MPVYNVNGLRFVTEGHGIYLKNNIKETIKFTENIIYRNIFMNDGEIFSCWSFRISVEYKEKNKSWDDSSECGD
ncbi:hypothetical protein PV327_009489 [Microctonus hyperodae]|uniref:Uncharacterized protein n=1 Tax=Microctonus hyperodae TaxID=165561 RepID=A0AA39KVS0_MICHY|nr:hypothetical protein PV327_009489 [Microctonus hyperodae]